MDQHLDLDVPLASPKTEDQDRDQEIGLRFPEINQRRGQEFIEAATNYPWLMDIEKQQHFNQGFEYGVEDQSESEMEMKVEDIRQEESEESHKFAQIRRKKDNS